MPFEIALIWGGSSLDRLLLSISINYYYYCHCSSSTSWVLVLQEMQWQVAERSSPYDEAQNCLQYLHLLDFQSIPVPQSHQLKEDLTEDGSRCADYRDCEFMFFLAVEFKSNIDDDNYCIKSIE